MTVIPKAGRPEKDEAGTARNINCYIAPKDLGVLSPRQAAIIAKKLIFSICKNPDICQDLLQSNVYITIKTKVNE